MTTRKGRSAKAELVPALVHLGVVTLKKHGPEVVDAILKHGPIVVDKGVKAVHSKRDKAREEHASRKAANEKATPKANPKPPTGPECPTTEVGASREPLRRSPIHVLSVNADAPGQDRYNLNGEWVVFRVLEGGTLLGYGIENGRGAHYRFGDRELKPGQETCLYTGSGKDSNSRLHWGSSEPVWDNDHDVVRVLDPDGHILETYRYDYGVE